MKTRRGRPKGGIKHLDPCKWQTLAALRGRLQAFDQLEAVTLEGFGCEVFRAAVEPMLSRLVFSAWAHRLLSKVGTDRERHQQLAARLELKFGRAAEVALAVRDSAFFAQCAYLTSALGETRKVWIRHRIAASWRLLQRTLERAPVDGEIRQSVNADLPKVDHVTATEVRDALDQLGYRKRRRGNK